ncbi:Ribosomal protein S18 acetylase RimI [Oceanobacillus limi]|uniref:Ribosomal protein S18 acetylase RimI n=1 Tax=Oceanobacillus limi TaxID=930131 RepID=A0A1H9YD47_9BACI|nr:GNAT family N-acetyltransferase [Oceanobacillus limi]SES66819.1 Ribosomal protein S18 acetylase RimI [Oceanobacillus limi]
MEENIEIVRFTCNDPSLDDIAKIYCRTFVGEYYSDAEKYSAIENLKKHANYHGFKGLKAINEAGMIVGFTYGYTSLPEQFYRRKLASQLSKEEINTWLSSCFEFVELAVIPSYKRLGIGSRLHDDLLENLHHTTSILTTDIDNVPAINLYKTKGWQVIKSHSPVISINNLQVIMGKGIN